MTVAVRVIPCLDVDAGRVVKGVNFANLRDAGDPVELARRYGAEGADELTFLDVTASSGNRETTYDIVARTAEEVFIPLTVGGGVRTAEDVDRLLRAGADKVGINTGAIARPEVVGEIADRFGSQVLVLSADVRRNADGWFEVTTHGGRQGTGHGDPDRRDPRRIHRSLVRDDVAETAGLLDAFHDARIADGAEDLHALGGEDRADPRAMAAAIRMAATCAQHRLAHG